METKFHLLPIGQHFEWEGKSYVKTTPLLASELPEGGQKFMPRAAMVQVAAASPAQQPPEPAALLESPRVRTAIEHYHRQALRLCDGSAGQQALEQAYRALLDELKL